jgi:CHASE1-domain containing sensor protein
MVRQRTSAPLRPALAAGWIAGVLFVLSFLVWGGLRYEESRSARERFDRQASEAREILAWQFERIEQVMLGAAALFAIKPDLTETE